MSGETLRQKTSIELKQRVRSTEPEVIRFKPCPVSIEALTPIIDFLAKQAVHEVLKEETAKKMTGD